MTIFLILAPYGAFALLMLVSSAGLDEGWRHAAM